MSGSRRVQKAERELREVISSYLISGFKRSLPGLVSIPYVRASGDLKSAKVFISLIGPDSTDDGYETCLEILNEYAFDVQKHVATHLQMKFCPKLRFYSDELKQTVIRVEELLHQNAKDRLQDNESQGDSNDDLTEDS